MATSTQNILECSYGYCHCQLLIGMSPRSAIGTVGVGSMTRREAPLNVAFLDPLSHGLGTQYLPFSLKISFVHVHMTSLVYGVQGCMCGHALWGALAGCTA